MELTLQPSAARSATFPTYPPSLASLNAEGKKKAGGSGKQEAGFLEGHLGSHSWKVPLGACFSARDGQQTFPSAYEMPAEHKMKRPKRQAEVTGSVRPGHVAVTQQCPAGAPQTGPGQVVHLSF